MTNPKNKHLHDLEPREWAALGPTLVLAVVMGVVPNFFLAPMAPSVDKLVQRLHAQRPALASATARPPSGADTTAGRPPLAGAVPVTTPRPVPAVPSLRSEQAAR